MQYICVTLKGVFSHVILTLKICLCKLTLQDLPLSFYSGSPKITCDSQVEIGLIRYFEQAVNVSDVKVQISYVKLMFDFQRYEKKDR